jgi:predicted MFS family arabinose efflux permease
MGDFKYKGKLLFIATAVFSISQLVFASSNIYLLSSISLVFVGWSSVTAVSLINTLLQTLVQDSFRGRVMSAFMFTFAGVMPFGNLIAGSLTQWIGAPAAVFISGLACAVFFVGINLRYPELSKL